METIDRDDIDPSLLDVQERIIKRELSKPGYKSKIRAFCCHCIYDPYQRGTWLQQVEAKPGMSPQADLASWRVPSK